MLVLTNLHTTLIPQPCKTVWLFSLLTAQICTLFCCAIKDLNLSDRKSKKSSCSRMPFGEVQTLSTAHDKSLWTPGGEQRPMYSIFVFGISFHFVASLVFPLITMRGLFPQHRHHFALTEVCVFHPSFLWQSVIKSWSPPTRDARHLPLSAAGDL